MTTLRSVVGTLMCVSSGGGFNIVMIALWLAIAMARFVRVHCMHSDRRVPSL